MKTLEHTSFPEIAERTGALYSREEDALLLGMLGQEYMVSHNGIALRGQRAPESHAMVIVDYLFSPGTTLAMMPWRSIGELTGQSSPDFRQRVEEPLAAAAGEIIGRANALLPMLDAHTAMSIIGSDMAINVRALPKVYLHVELSQETRDFPAEAWVLFSNNAHEFAAMPVLQILAELLKDRFLSLLRIY